MSLLRNLLGDFMPHFEARSITAQLNALNAEVVHTLSGDDSAIINLSGTVSATYVIEGSADGTNYFALMCFPYGSASVSGNLPSPAQPVYTEGLVATNLMRVLNAATGQLKKIRVRLSTYTSGTMFVTINSDSCMTINPYVSQQKASTLMVTATAAVSNAVTATLPAVAGLRHYIDRIDVTRSATAALTASAVPVLVTTTNIPGLPVLSFGADTGGVGVDKVQSIDFGATGIACTASSTATTIVCPVYTGVIWRVNVAYRLGM